MRVIRAAVLFCAAPFTASACDVALAFAVDVSGSVSSRAYQVQLDGVAAGLHDPVVSRALIDGQASLAVLQWTGSRFQHLSIPWTAIRSPTDLAAFTQRLQRLPRAWSGTNTAIGPLLSFAQNVFANAPDCYRNVLDVSGNGPSNEGHGTDHPRAALEQAGVTVNAIVIDPLAQGLREYFAAQVITGPGAFVMDVSGIETFGDGMREKLLRELALQYVLADP